jgi:hypothetical protein
MSPRRDLVEARQASGPGAGASRHPVLDEELPRYAEALERLGE